MRRSSFRSRTSPVKEKPRAELCGHGMIANSEANWLNSTWPFCPLYQLCSCFFIFCTDANRKAPFEEGDNCAWVECSVWSAEPQFSLFCFAGSFPFSRCQRGPLERSVGAQTCRRKRVGKGRLRRGGGTAQPQLLCLWHEISLALCSLPAENESGNRVNCA